MQVKKLIEHLRTLDPEAHVYIDDDEYPAVTGVVYETQEAVEGFPTQGAVLLEIQRPDFEVH